MDTRGINKYSPSTGVQVLITSAAKQILIIVLEISGLDDAGLSPGGQPAVPGGSCTLTSGREARNWQGYGCWEPVPPRLRWVDVGAGFLWPLHQLGLENVPCLSLLTGEGSTVAGVLKVHSKSNQVWLRGGDLGRLSSESKRENVHEIVLAGSRGSCCCTLSSSHWWSSPPLHLCTCTAPVTSPTLWSVNFP